MTKLTKRNYFTIKNQYISKSKISDWLKDENFFYRKHVLGEVERKVTDPIIKGSAVDTWLTNGEKKFREQYIQVTRRSTSDPNYEYQLNKSMYEEVERMCRKVELQTAYKQLRGFKKQTILQYDMDLGMFPGICGIPDWFKIKDDKCIIVDLKTTENAEPYKYTFKCEQYGYHKQMAMYTMLITKLFGIRKFEYRHLAVEKDLDNINNVYCYLLDEDKVAEEYMNILEILRNIKKETKFLPRDANWEEMLVV